MEGIKKTISILKYILRIFFFIIFFLQKIYWDYNIGDKLIKNNLSLQNYVQNSIIGVIVTIYFYRS